MAYRILLADDDPQILRLLKSYLTQAGFITITAIDGESALHLLRAELPDMLVLDVMMPKRDGFSVLQIARADRQLAHMPVLMLTARIDDVDRLRGLEGGADDYLNKPFNPLEVVARVRAILRRANGEMQLSPILQHQELRLDVRRHSAQLGESLVDLTPVEFDLLRVMMQHPNHAFTRSELIEAVFGQTYEGFDRTIDSHIKNLRRKIEPDPTAPRYVQTVFGVGYRVGGGSGGCI